MIATAILPWPDNAVRARRRDRRRGDRVRHLLHAGHDPAHARRRAPRARLRLRVRADQPRVGARTERRLRDRRRRSPRRPRTPCRTSRSAALAAAYACRAVEVSQAPRSEPRRDRAPGLPHGARARASRPSRSRRPTTSARCTPARPTSPSASARTSGRRSTSRRRCGRGADAVHPGYGFLAESGDFAEAVGAAGLLWIGPPPDALRAGGDKVEARRIAIEAGVPVVPGGAPEELGFPLLVKAAAGGGGRGMRVVRSRGRARRRRRGGARARRRRRSATTGCSSSATSSGRGTSRSSCSPTRTAPCSRSASASARCSAATRRCSRRRPSVALDPDLRARMSEAAIRFARAVGYVGAGTAEFVLEGREFHFLELNGRIQVEHPVTEAVTGLDLVEQQIRDRPRRARSTVRRRAARARGRGAALRRGSAHVPPAGRADRAAAAAGGDPRRRGRRGGRRGRHRLRPDAREADRARAHARRGARPPRGRARRDRGRGRDDEPAVPPLARRAPGAARGRDDDGVPRRPPAALAPARRRAGARVARRRGGSTCPSPPPAPPPDVDDPAHRHGGPATEQSSVVAPMPGTVLRVLVAPGDAVEARQPLVVLEAMKMETPLVAPYAATVAAVHVERGRPRERRRARSSSSASSAPRGSRPKSGVDCLGIAHDVPRGVRGPIAPSVMKPRKGDPR